MKELLKSKNRHILSDQKVTRISIDACSTTLSSNVATFLGFACFDIILLPLGQCGILSMIDTPVSLY